ncbi:MAG TPA: metallophosphoesterase [Nocardioidaceae bacterium]|nr:metallophosphoesterase [Nocardioidaceae bacterium]
MWQPPGRLRRLLPPASPEGTGEPGQRQPSGRRWRGWRESGGPLLRRTLGYLLVWLVLTVPLTGVLFLHSSQSTVIASHEAVVRPTLDGYVTLDLGPYLPNLRYPTGSTLGEAIDLGRTNATSYSTLIQRYAFIGSQPEGEIAKLRHVLVDLALDSAITAGAVAALVPGVWLLLGRRRRSEIFGHLTVRRVGAGALVVVVVGVAVIQPWNWPDDDFEQEVVWQTLPSALPDVPIPDAAAKVQVESGLITSGTKRLAESAVDTYTKSLRFYNDAALTARALSPQLRQPGEGETAVLLVSDRHDNIGMDKVARAIADAAGATALFDAGDDTSTGSSWEAFSLESLNSAFDDFDRFMVAGNHDHGDFVATYLADLGFHHLKGKAVEGPGGIRLLGVDDPRSSGLGSWRDTSGLTFDEHRQQLGDLVCEYDARGERITTLLVHDANSGDDALARGCVDLVVGGHIHSQLGPTRVMGSNGEIGYTYTNGTTGGAAYALAIGSKLRRNAEVTVITYRDGEPLGLQPVTLRTTGTFRVGEFVPFDFGSGQVTDGRTDGGTGDQTDGAADGQAEPPALPGSTTTPELSVPGTTDGPSPGGPTGSP